MKRPVATISQFALMLCISSCHLFLSDLGGEGQACFDDKTCNANLVCSADNVCEKLAGDGGAGSDAGEPHNDAGATDGPSAPDSGSDAAEDSGADAGDTGIPLDGGFDAGPDAGDTGVVIPDGGIDGGIDAGTDAGVPAAACHPWSPTGGGFAACGRMVNSSGDMTGGGFSVRGAVTDGITRTPASGGGFTVR